MSDVRVAEVGRAAGMPESAASCHVAQVGGYAVIGHVPVETIRRLLRERPAIAGLSVPGMIAGTPGMGEPTPFTHYDVVAVTRDGHTSVYERH